MKSKEEKFVSDGSEFVFTKKEAKQAEERSVKVEQAMEKVEENDRKTAGKSKE